MEVLQLTDVFPRELPRLRVGVAQQVLKVAGVGIRELPRRRVGVAQQVFDRLVRGLDAGLVLVHRGALPATASGAARPR